MVQLLNLKAPASVPGSKLEIIAWQETTDYFCKEHNQVQPYYVWKEGRLVPTCEECFLEGAILAGDILEADCDTKVADRASDSEAETRDKKLAN